MSLKAKKTYKVALIGSTGFIAENLYKALHQKQIPVLCIGRHKPELANPEDFIKFDLSGSNPPQVTDYDVETVIFNAALKGRFPESSGEYALQGQICAPDFEVLFSQLNLQTNRLITMGSSEEYGPQQNDLPITERTELKPVSSYGYWKSQLYRQGLKWSQKNSSSFVHLRPFNVYGEGLDQKMFLGSMITTLLQDKTFHMTKGEQFRSFVAVDVLVEAVLKFIEFNDWTPYHNNNALNVSTQHYYQLSDVARLISQKIKKGHLDVGSVPYREDEVWHQRPSLEFIEQLDLKSSRSSFESDLQRVISDCQKDIQHH